MMLTFCIYYLSIGATCAAFFGAPDIFAVDPKHRLRDRILFSYFPTAALWPAWVTPIAIEFVKDFRTRL